MHRPPHNNASTENIPNEWLVNLEKDNLAKTALKGPSEFLISNILQYSKQLVVLGSITKMLVNLN